MEDLSSFLFYLNKEVWQFSDWKYLQQMIFSSSASVDVSISFSRWTGIESLRSADLILLSISPKTLWAAFVHISFQQEITNLNQIVNT